MKYKIAPSILSADLARLGEDVARVLEAGADMVHFDVMDNHYVPNLTFGAPVLQALRTYGIKAPMDVHLMVEPVDGLIGAFIDAGADIITFHPEASRHIHRSLQLIKDAGIKCGLVLNPGTSTAVLEPVIGELDQILLMSVNPGFGGQTFIPSTYDKIAQVRQMIVTSGRDIRLQVDGGIKVDNIAKVAQAGADTFVAGSAIFGAGDYKAIIDQMRGQLMQLHA